MIGYAGGIRYLAAKKSQQGNLNAKPTPRWPLSELEKVEF
jgi:tRNA A37 threonylcarbamoyltransferase TsaD